MKVYILWHTRELGDGEEDSKLIGVYSTISNGEAALQKSALLPGFRDHPEGFLLEPYDVDRDHWTEGFVTIVRPS